MIIDVVRLPDDGMRYEGDEDCSIFRSESDELVRFKGPVHYVLDVSLVGDELIITGKISMNAEFMCSRCSEYSPLYIEESAFLQSMELDLDTQSVDLTGDIREAMLLLFPAYPICSSECRGICPQCGVNFNKASCECKKPEDVRWNKLDDLAIEE